MDFLVSDLEPDFTKSVVYHDLFSYPLHAGEMLRWQAGKKVRIDTKNKLVMYHGGYFFLDNRNETVLGRLMARKTSKRKMKRARRAGKLLAKVGGVEFVGVTGSLAMSSAKRDSDIDLMVITREGRLWVTRLVCYLLLLMSGFSLRRPGNEDERDRLCMNIWLDKSDLEWKEKNVFTAHEIVQIKSLVNKNNTYNQFLFVNSWVRGYWPNAARVARDTKKVKGVDTGQGSVVGNLIEWLVFKLQYSYMKRKITRETVTKTRALFHPIDWSENVMGRLK